MRYGLLFTAVSRPNSSLRGVVIDGALTTENILSVSECYYFTHGGEKNELEKRVSARTLGH